VTVVAEAAFQDRLWRPGLEPLADLASIRIVRCTVDAAVAEARIGRRLEADVRRAAHDDRELLRALASGEAFIDDFVRILIAAPMIRVDTTDGYDPAIPEIVAFIEHRRDG
jgi:hypothetical protein